MSTAFAAFGLAFVACLAIERIPTRPGAPLPGLPAIPARLLVTGLLYLFWLGAWGRPFLAALACIVTVAVMSAISVRKRQLVGEPLNFSDFGLLRMIVRHPDLYYMGFMARPPFLIGAALFCLGLGTWLWIEPAYRVLSGAASFCAALGVPLLAWLVWRMAPLPIVAGPLARIAPVPDPDRHLGRWGLLLTLVVYALRWKAETERDWAAVGHPPADVPISNLNPARVVVVQFESFLDPGRCGLAEIPLPSLACARDLAILHGPLRVPAHGAFTMRSEHAVLSGLGEAALGFRRFDPYLTARGPAPATLASGLKARGFRTVFLHPFRPGFFGRDRIIPRLGFDRMLFEADFAGDERTGPYVSDRAMVRRILAELDGPGPVLVSAVTMENHGPWSEGRLPDEPDPTRQYLRHLAGADEAIRLLIEGLSGLGGTTLLCLYGDHPPILPGLPPSATPETDYALLVLGAPQVKSGPPRTVTADELGRIVMRMAGIGGSAAATPSAGTAGRSASPRASGVESFP